MSTQHAPGAHSFKPGRYYKRMHEGKSVMRSYEDIRRDELANEYFAESYEECVLLRERHVIDYIVELEHRLTEVTDVDMRAEWTALLIGDQGEA